MFLPIGLLVVIISIIGGYLGAGGHLHVLWQPFEFIIIFGSAIGTIFIANPKGVLQGLLQSCKTLISGNKYNKTRFMDVLSVMYSIFKLAKTKGDLALESHVENPDQSSIFQNYSSFLGDHKALEFFCDYLRLLTLGTANPHEIDTVMDAELEIRHAEKQAVIGAIQSAADALPALGIVAAVLGVIHTMSSITEPPEVLGRLIGGALVGTFTGVLAAYGIVGPIAKQLEAIFAAEHRYLECIKAGIIAHMQGYAPQVSVEFARKTIDPDLRPSFAEVDSIIQSIRI
jgi:chemotaxis protein MotA